MIKWLRSKLGLKNCWFFEFKHARGTEVATMEVDCYYFPFFEIKNALAPEFGDTIVLNYFPISTREYKEHSKVKHKDLSHDRTQN
jgi:hypothetical protein